MAIIYSKRMMIQRLRQHVAKVFPNASFPASENETLLYIDQALAYSIVGKAYEGAKVEGSLVLPEAFYLTSLLPDLQQDNITSYWYTTLPQPPLSLPLGYSVSRIYFASAANGVSQSVYMVKAKRVAYRNDMPKPLGVSAWIEGSKLYMQANDGSPLLGMPVYATMASSRTENVNDTMNVSDDALELIFNNVVTKLKDRLNMPQDVVNDNIPAGTTNQMKQ